MSDFNYEVILCVVNAGFSESVMDAAREFGARGGTVIHARGTANAEAEKLFNISIQPEKEVVLILVEKECRDDILHALYQKVGLQSAGQGIAFCLPVEDVVGLTQKSDIAQKQTPQAENTTEQAPETEAAEPDANKEN